jgi:glycosyltransferase involved in cell wall biosynthesis
VGAFGHEGSKVGRVLVIYYSCSVVCGVGTWVESLSQELALRGWDVTVGLAWGRHFHDPRRIEACRPALKTCWMDGRTGTEEGRIQAIERTLRRLRPDVVILTCLDSAFEAVRRLRYGGTKVRLLATNHGNFAHQAASLLEQVDVVDLAVCVGRLSFEAMSSGAGAFPPERIRHLPNAVPLPFRAREAHDLSFRVGYAGRLDDEARKRASDLGPFFGALARLSTTAELWIAGDGPQEDALRAMAAPYSGRVRCFGRLTRTQLYQDFYPCLDVLVSFSSSEGWGLSIAEAMAHGVVPVSSAFSGIHLEGLVREGANGLVFPVGEPARAAELVAALFCDPVRLNRLARQAAVDIQEKYSPARFGEAWSRALTDCLALPELPPSPRPASLSRRSRCGLRESQWERIRRLLRRRVPHASAGEEWPHYRCRDAALTERLAREMAAIESRRASSNPSA